MAVRPVRIDRQHVPPHFILPDGMRQLHGCQAEGPKHRRICSHHDLGGSSYPEAAAGSPKAIRRSKLKNVRSYEPVAGTYREEMVLPGANVRLLVPGVMAR